MSKNNLDAIEDAEFEDAEQQLRLYGFGHIERGDEGWWFELVDVLRQYYDEHLHYPTKDEFRQLWRQDVDARIKWLKTFLARGTH